MQLHFLTFNGRPRFLLVMADGVKLTDQWEEIVVNELKRHPEAHFFYSDHDFYDGKISGINPMRKSEWSQELLRSMNYIGEGFVVQSDHLAKVMGSNMANLEDSILEHLEDKGWHDLILRLTEGLERRQIAHIPEILLHFPLTTEQREEEKRTTVPAVKSHLDRLGVKAIVSATIQGHCRVRYTLSDPLPIISIIIPTKDKMGLLRRCVESILFKSTYQNYEILIVDNGSRSPDSLRYLNDLSKEKQITILRHEGKFNFSLLNNSAAREARGEILSLLNNDIEVLSADWMETMAGHLMQPGIGVVGAKLLFPNGKVQHGGDAVGPRGSADHMHSGIGGNDPGYASRAVVAQDLSAVTGACLMTRKDLYEQLSGLDEKNLPIAFNDADYCLRVREAGFRVIWTPHAILTHHELASRGRRSIEDYFQLFREKKYFQKRWKIGEWCDPFYGRAFNQKRADFSLRTQEKNRCKSLQSITPKK